MLSNDFQIPKRGVVVVHSGHDSLSIHAYAPNMERGIGRMLSRDAQSYVLSHLTPTYMDTEQGLIETFVSDTLLTSKTGKVMIIPERSLVDGQPILKSVTA